MSTISPLTLPVPVTAPSASIVPREGRLNDLRVDQIVHAAVVEGGFNRVLLELGQKRIQAESRIPLKSGQSLTLQVVATAPRLELRVVEDLLAERLGRLLTMLGTKWDILPLVRDLSREELPLAGRLSRDARETLSAVLELLSSPSDVPDGDSLRKLLLRLGLDLENRLAGKGSKGASATLKSAFTEALNLAGPQGELAPRLNATLAAMELLQLCSIRMAAQGTTLVPFPLPYLEKGFLIVEGEARNNGREGPLRVSLHLALEGLGNLRVDLLYETQGLLLRLACDSQEKADFITRFQEELDAGLRPFPLQGTVISAGAEEPGQALLKRVWPENSVLDTRV